MMRSWKMTGLLATLVILLIPPLYLLRRGGKADPGKSAGVIAPVAFTGNAACRDCHRETYDRWHNSHHDRAMDVATEETVLGDFDNSTFTHRGQVSRFYRRDGRFFVHTPGPDGKPGEFEITHTFGWTPLQQYLVPFPGGRLQCLSIVWDVERKQWYHLYPDQALDSSSWFYWTNQSQNWNGMCAECHTTYLQKNYDAATDTFQTRFVEMDVGCEACHGPGAAHVAWAELPAMGRPAVQDYALTVSTRDISARRQVELCAPCHARRASLADNRHEFKDFLDYASPQLLHQGFYYADGQILEEVYVYGSFVQSKMYDREVVCNDCHDVHSVKRHEEGNALCLQCHRAELYDTRTHHFHKKAGEDGEPVRGPDGSVLFAVGTGAQCEACHMPGKHYMGIDYRPDHSFRVPRPDLTVALKVPNACNRCHRDKTAQWSAEWITKWYGTKSKPHYGTVMAAGRQGSPEAQADLIRTFRDDLLPPIVRSTALALLAHHPDPQLDQLFQQALLEPEAIIRQAAARHWNPADPQKLAAGCLPLLYDEVKAVRIEAAGRLLQIRSEQFKPLEKARLAVVQKEYEAALFYSADMPATRHNLGNYFAGRGELDKAVKHYQKAIQLDREFYPAQVNLAMLYNRQGKNEVAETLLRDVLRANPEMYDIHYSLGLLLAEEQKFVAAVESLGQAARGLPQRPRVHYNLGLLLAQMRRDEAAEKALRHTLTLDPGNRDYLFALVDFLLKRERFEEALPLAEQLAANFPDWPAARQILEFVRSKTAS